MKVVAVVSFIVAIAIAAVGFGSVDAAPYGGAKIPPGCGTDAGL